MTPCGQFGLDRPAFRGRETVERHIADGQLEGFQQPVPGQFPDLTFKGIDGAAQQYKGVGFQGDVGEPEFPGRAVGVQLQPGNQRAPNSGQTPECGQISVTLPRGASLLCQKLPDEASLPAGYLVRDPAEL